MLAVERIRVYEAACEGTLSGASGNQFPSSVEHRKEGHSCAKQNSELDKSYRGKIYLPTKVSSPRKFKSNGAQRQETPRDDKLVSASEILLHEDTSAKFMFPEFFPRDKMISFHAEFELLHRIQADPILCSWMLFFGHQTTK